MLRRYDLLVLGLSYWTGWRLSTTHYLCGTWVTLTAFGSTVVADDETTPWPVILLLAILLVVGIALVLRAKDIAD